MTIPSTDTPLAELREIPIEFRVDFRPLPVSRTFPVDLSMPLSNEPRVDALTTGLNGESFYARTDGWNAPYYEALPSAPREIFLRKSVVERLHRVNDRLRRDGLELFLLDGWRPIQCQQELYDFFYRNAQKANPGFNDEQVRAYIKDFVADPSAFDPNDSKTWTPHVTGAAVDLTIRRIATGEWLEFGGVFDDPAKRSLMRHYETMEKDPDATEREARANRRMLFWIMMAEGFGAVPTEWWHYDWGNQSWSRNRGLVEEEHPMAWYGPVEPQ